MYNNQTITSLRQTGLSVVGTLTAAELIGTNTYLLSRPVYVNAHVPATAHNRTRDGVAGVNGLVPRDQAYESECVCVRCRDALLAPHLLERALGLIDLAAEYLGVEIPYLYSTSAFWTRPGQAAERGDIQAFHRDQDDSRFLAMFTYLSDVSNEHDGPHDLEGPDGKIRTVYGGAGTIFLADTSHRHRGRKPMERERGIHWFRWGVSERPAAYGWDGTRPVAAAPLGDRYPADARLRRVLSPLVT